MKTLTMILLVLIVMSGQLNADENSAATNKIHSLRILRKSQ